MLRRLTKLMAARHTPGSRRLNQEMAIAFRPVVRGFLAAVGGYYALLTLSYIVFPPEAYPLWEYALMLSLLSTSALAAGLMHRLSRNLRNDTLIELTSLAAAAIVLINITVQMGLRFQPENLVYFILAIPIFAISCVSLRSMIAAVLTTVAAMVFFSATQSPELLVQYLFLAIAAVFSAVGMATLMRGAILRAIEARLESDTHRAKAETLTSRAERLAAQTRDQAEQDSLTGLANRLKFFNAFGTALANPRLAERNLVLAVIDLDGFKPVNDSFGHATGDLLLAEVARRLRATVPRRTMIARMGSNEFAILIQRDRLGARIEDFGHSLCAAIDKAYVLNSHIAKISASIGLVVCQKTGPSIHQLMEQADYALRHAKRQARGEAVLFDASLEAEMQSIGRVDLALRACDLERELHVVFQPQYDLLHDRTYGFEVLARWRSDTLGSVAPDVFIKAAEASGQIRQVTQVLLRKALEIARHWPEDLGLAFNLSAHDLMSPVAVSQLLEQVRGSGIAPSRIEFEITETSMMADFDRARSSIGRIAAAGCKLALDDFGSGYSNFSYLHQLPVNKIKIDRAFVTPLLKDNSARKIIGTIINLSRSLDLDCVIEGVEFEGELDLLRAMDARFIQGYYFAKPMSAQDVTGYLATERVRVNDLPLAVAAPPRAARQS